MNALWLAFGVIIGAGVILIALRPRLRVLTVDAARGIELERELVKTRSDLEHERERAAERLATVNDAQERLSASFKVLDGNSMLNAMFNHGFAYWIYGGMSVLAALFVIRYVPETKGRSLEAIQDLWGQQAANQAR